MAPPLSTYHNNVNVRYQTIFIPLRQEKLDSNTYGDRQSKLFDTLITQIKDLFFDAPFLKTVHFCILQCITMISSCLSLL